MDEEAAASAMPVGEEQENKENENANDEPKTDAAMEEEASQSAAVEEPVEKNKPEKKVRRRKKGLYQAIRKQIEFYFSDANLAKDRFMQKITSNTDEVDLEVFMKFNKIRSLSEDVKEIVAALRKSTFLKLDATESHVSRTTPFIPTPQSEVDSRTIYVEQMPPLADLQWVHSIFSEFGAIAYVSLPKFRGQSRNKGFAFVEFQDVDSAIKAVESYTATSLYSNLEADPSRLCSIQAFKTDKELDQKAKRKEKGEEEDDEDDEDQEEGAGDEEEKEKAEEEQDQEEEVQEPAKKKRKVRLEPAEEVQESAKEAQVPVEETEEPAEEAQVPAEEAQEPAKSKRRRKRRNSGQRRDDHVHREAQTLTLQVMSKKDWKKLRNKYLDLQRKCHRLKVMNANRAGRQVQSNRPAKAAEAPSEEAPPAAAAAAAEAMAQEAPPAQPPSAEAAAEAPELGTIVKIVLEEPISDARRFKTQVRSRPEVHYVEAEDLSQVAFVRCTGADAARSLVEQNIWKQSEILQGEEERHYWKKIEEGRQKKRQTATRQRNRRHAATAPQSKSAPLTSAAASAVSSGAAGRGKGSHIRFDDDDDQVE